MSDSRQMERKLNMPAPKSLQANNKTDAKKPTDSSNSKYSNRRNGKSIAIQSQRTESSRNIGPKKTSNNCKQPPPRASLFCRKKSSEVTESLNDVEDDDILSLLRQREPTREWNLRSGYGSRKKELPQKFNIKHFLIANCQFVVKFGKDYSQWMLNQDEIVSWDCIEQIKMFSTQSIKCPICMDIPITSKMTRCGHIYCWPCILRYLDINKELDITGCPICHSRISKKELQSVEIIVKKECCVGQPITLQLMKRARNSLQAYPISELRQNTYRLSDNIPLSVCESKFSTSYSRILIGHKSQVLDILNKERESLVLLLDNWETEDIEKKYIYEALELLSTREDLLINKESNSEIKSADLESIDYTLIPSQATPPILKLQNMFEIPGSSYNAPNVLENNSSLKQENLIHNIQEINLNSKNGHEVLQKKPAKKDFYFYQAVDGQHIYLSAVNVEMLECMFGCLENSPQLITANVIEKQYLSMTEALRKRYRFLLHLPITTVFEWVELDLANIVNPETLFIFKTNLDERKAIRDRRVRDEQRLAKRIEERNNKKQLPPPEWHNKNVFPDCGYDPFADKSMVPLSESIGITSTLEQNLGNSPNSSPNNLSFAKALQNESITNNPDMALPNVSSQWPLLGSRSNSMPISNMLEDAIANINLHDNKSKNKKKKRNKYEKYE
ncbi:RING finger protein 10, partial [Sipha flava]